MTTSDLSNHNTGDPGAATGGKRAIDWRAHPSVTSASMISDETAAVMALTVDVEKRLCAILGRKWTATGISIESLCQEIEQHIPVRASSPSPARLTDEPSQATEAR